MVTGGGIVLVHQCGSIRPGVSTCAGCGKTWLWAGKERREVASRRAGARALRRHRLALAAESRRGRRN